VSSDSPPLSLTTAKSLLSLLTTWCYKLSGFGGIGSRSTVTDAFIRRGYMCLSIDRFYVANCSSQSPEQLYGNIAYSYCECGVHVDGDK
jgi:hypothetical protein